MPRAKAIRGQVPQFQTHDGNWIPASGGISVDTPWDSEDSIFKLMFCIEKRFPDQSVVAVLEVKNIWDESTWWWALYVHVSREGYSEFKLFLEEHFSRMQCHSVFCSERNGPLIELPPLDTTRK
jgi:hypothetical protein